MFAHLVPVRRLQTSSAYITRRLFSSSTLVAKDPPVSAESALYDLANVLEEMADNHPKPLPGPFEGVAHENEVESLGPVQVQSTERYKGFHLQQFFNPKDLEISHRRMIPRRARRRDLNLSADESYREDAFRQLKIDPLDECRNPYLLSHFVTELGKLKSRRQMGLTWWSQRKVTKAIKRSQNMGIMPVLSKRHHRK